MQTNVQARFTEREGRAVWRSMFDEVNGARLMASSLSQVLGKLAILFPLFAAALALSWLGDSPLQLAAGCFALALLLAQFAFIGHDAGHGAISRTAAVDRALGQASMTLVTGLAYDEWIRRHLAHHRFCQDEDRDPDIAVDFAVSLTIASKAKKNALGRFLTRYQAIHIWLLSFLFGHSQRVLSQVAVLGGLRRNFLDAAVLLLHFGLWFGIPCLLLDVSMPRAFLVYLLPLTLLGPYLAAIFWVNHIGMPLVRDSEQISFFEHQYITSRTITSPQACNWLFGGLNYQIEHHLFPQVPSARLGSVQAIVRRHFVRHEITYHGVSWSGAVRAIAAHLHSIARA